MVNADGPTLRTARLLLRAMRPEDADLLHRLRQERDPHVPAHRRLDTEGRPGPAALADRTRTTPPACGPGLPTVLHRSDGIAVGCR